MISVPYDELDSNIVGVVRTLNSFPGILTVGSCGGHKDSETYQNREGTWSVVLQLETEDSRPLREAWLSLEFLVYAFNNWFYRSGLKVAISAYSAPPHFNYPGDTITFSVDGEELPDEIAELLSKMKAECFQA